MKTHLGSIGRCLGALSLTLSVALAAQAQLVTLEPVERPPRDLPLQYNLWEAERLAAERHLEGDELRVELERRGNTVRGGLIHVEIVGPEGSEALSHAFVEGFGGVGDTRWRHRLDAWVPVARLSEIARAIPDGYFVERATAGCPDDVVGQGPDVINSSSYRNNGQNGHGLTVAVIDGGYSGLSAAQNNGDVGSYSWVNYTWSGLEETTTHGTGCVEAMYDHCPGATFWLYKTDSIADEGSAVEHAIDHGVHIISHSMSRYNTGWNDNSGDACAAADEAAQAGILYFTAAGNRAKQHWQGHFYPGAGDPDVHDWSYGDETIDMVVSAGAIIGCYLSWQGGGVYMLDLLDSSLKRVATSAGHRFQEINYENDTGSDQTMYLVVFRGLDPATGEFELFVHPFAGTCTWQEHWIPEGSTTSPSNATDSRVISVGAVAWDDFGSPQGTGDIVMSYSGQGPSNGGMTLPDLVGPTNTQGFTYPGGFTGTSCATPNVAGAAACFLSADPAIDAYPLWWLMAVQSQNWRDWGVAGIDPFYTIQAAHDWSVPGGRIAILGGGVYPEPALLSEEVTIESLTDNAVLGQE
jgi:subtilisin family serine protease